MRRRAAQGRELAGEEADVKNRKWEEVNLFHECLCTENTTVVKSGFEVVRQRHGSAVGGKRGTRED